MAKKDSSTIDDKRAPKKGAVKREGNPLERERSFVRQRSAVLRPPDQSEKQAAADGTQQGFANDEQDDNVPTADYKQKVAQYRSRQHQASESRKKPESSGKESNGTE